MAQGPQQAAPLLRMKYSATRMRDACSTDLVMVSSSSPPSMALRQDLQTQRRIDSADVLRRGRTCRETAAAAPRPSCPPIMPGKPSLKRFLSPGGLRAAAPASASSSSRVSRRAATRHSTVAGTLTHLAEDCHQVNISIHDCARHSLLPNSCSVTTCLGLCRGLLITARDHRSDSETWAHQIYYKLFSHAQVCQGTLSHSMSTCISQVLAPCRAWT